MSKYKKLIVEYLLLLLVGLLAGYLFLNSNFLDKPMGTEENGNYASFFQNRDDKLILLSTSWCPSCKNLRKYFKEHDIEYSEFDVEKSKTGSMLLAKANENIVPVLISKNFKVSGMPTEEQLGRLFEDAFKKRVKR